MARLHDGENCPCPSDCSRHGKCAQCIKFHHGRGESTYCEYLHGGKEPEQPERAIPSGREIRMLDYAPCAG